MIRSEAVARVRAGLSFRTSSTTLNNEIVEALQKSQRLREMGKTLPWFLKEEDDSLSFTANDPEIPLPTGFLREIADENLWWDGDSDDDRRELQKIDFAQGKRLYVNTTDTNPVAYALRKSSLWLFPTPDFSGTCTWSYYKADSLLTADDSENSWLLYAPDLLIADAGVIVAADLEIESAVSKFQALARREEMALFGDIIERELENYPIIMGGNN
jgi:hypothetical protein